MAALVGTFGVAAAAFALPDSTWVQLASAPATTHSPVFALAVDPNQNQTVIGGTTDGVGEIFRSTDGGSSWSAVRQGTGPVLTISFSPFKPGLVLAGLRNGGVLMSTDSGATWAATSGSAGRSARVFAFSRPAIAAGTDRGVYISTDGSNWAPAGLPNVDVDALAAAAVNPPVHFVAAGQAGGPGGSLGLYQSNDAGASWAPVPPTLGSSTIASVIVAGPLPPPPASVRPLLAGTNSGLFSSSDNGSTFAVVTGGGALPATDYNHVAFVTDHSDHFYVSSDGGASSAGGIWFSPDGGATFSGLDPPVASVTALAVSNDEAPIIYAASFSNSGDKVTLWAYHDTGGPPHQPNGSPTTVASSPRTASPQPSSGSPILQALSSPAAPYVAIGVIALLVLLVALIANLRSGRR